MKFKVGDKVRIIENKSSHEFVLGTMVEIIGIDGEEYKCYGKDVFGNMDFWFVRENEIELFEYNWKDFLKAPIGTKVTFENGYVLVKYYDGGFTNFIKCRRYDSLEGFKDVCGCGCLGKIIKIEEPTYTTVYEQKEEVTMPEIEEMKRLTDELYKTCDEFIKKIKEK